jgi:hypothetical protein
VPAPGEHVTVGGVGMVIESVEGDVVASALVLPPNPTPAAEDAS